MGVSNMKNVVKACFLVHEKKSWWAQTAAARPEIIAGDSQPHLYLFR